LHAGLLTAVTLGLFIATALWWTYFGSLAARAEARLRAHDDPVLAAADAYSYLHLLIVAGIIVYAVGVKFAVAQPAEPLGEAARLALCGGIALYLAGLVAFQLRLLSTLDLPHAMASLAALAVFAICGGADAWVTELALTAVMAFLVVREVASRA
jgi:low temperature requirement protein LtrA